MAQDEQGKAAPAAGRTEGVPSPDQVAYFELLRRCLLGSEERMMDVLMVYTIDRGYSAYTSTLREAWRVSIQGLTESMIAALDAFGGIPELGPEEDYTAGPVAAFATKEARLHRERGVPLAMFLGLMKYYQQSYRDVIAECGFDADQTHDFHLFVDRFFGRVEIGFLEEWTSHTGDELLDELRQTNRRMTNEKNKYLTIFESLRDPVILLDEAGKIENLNLAASRIFLGRETPGSVYYGDSDVVVLLPWLPAPLEAFRASGEDEGGFDLDIDTAAGRRVFEGKFARMQDISRKFAGTVAILNDVTDREAAREQLQGAHDDLEQRVRQRTAELEQANARLVEEMQRREQIQQQLVHSQKLEAVGQLAGGVAHDLNNLLQIVLGNTFMLGAGGKLDEAQQGHVAEIDHATDRATALVRQLLLFSRRQPMKFEPLDVNSTVAHLSRMLERIIGEKVRIEMDLSDRVLPVIGDPGCVEQVLMNLVVNARDAMPGGGTITVRTEEVHFSGEEAEFPGVRPGEFVRLVVEDEGEGMSPEIREHIFEPFFSTKAVGEGTGLGLSVVHGIVEQHEGWVDVYSELGLGTVFRVYLPSVDEELSLSDVISIAPEDLRGAGERVLVVEDEAGVRAFTAGVLAEYGYEVTAVQTGEEAQLAVQESGPFDAVLSDVVLPGISGPELVERLLVTDPDLRVLFVSGYTSQSQAWNRIRERGFSLLPKPFPVSDLLRAVRKLLR